MKKLFLLLFAAVIMFSCSENKQDPEQNEQGEMQEKSTDLGGGAYGYERIDENNAMPLADLYKNIKESDEPIAAKSSGKINQVCKHSGCWVTVELENGEEMLIEFKNEFAIPKEGVVGKTIYFKGKGHKETYSVEELKEMAVKDGKTTAEIGMITEPEYDISFVAEGVLIKE